MLTVTLKPRPGSSLRLLTLLAIAHAALAFYLWFCAFDVSLIRASVRLWQILSALWFVWPILLAVRAAVRFARFVRDASRPKPAPQGDARKPIFFVAPPRAPAPRAFALKSSTTAFANRALLRRTIEEGHRAVERVAHNLAVFNEQTL